MIIANNVQGAIWLSEDQSGLICLLPSNNLLLSFQCLFVIQSQFGC